MTRYEKRCKDNHEDYCLYDSTGSCTGCKFLVSEDCCDDGFKYREYSCKINKRQGRRRFK